MRVQKYSELVKLVGPEKAKEMWKAKKPKYGNRKTEIDGIKFDSIAESNYYAELVLMKKAGDIVSFELQPKFELVPSFTTSGGRNIRAMTYSADFKVLYPNGITEIVDVKGFANESYKAKRKQFLYQNECDTLKFVEIIKGERYEY